MDRFLLVAAGGAVGAMARYGLGLQALRLLGSAWPFGTLAANLIGGLLMGLLSGWLSLKGGGDPERFRLLLGVGVLGGFTTFSALSLETASMIERRELGSALAYALVSVVLSVLAVFAGLALARRGIA
jgi:CrcB protein